MIQSQCLFKETSVRIHECGHSECWSGNTRWWCEDPVLSRAWRLLTPQLPLCAELLTRFAVPGCILFDNATLQFEWSSWVWSSDLLSYWTWSGVVELPSFRHFIKSGVTRDNMAGIWAEDSSEPSTYTIYTNPMDLLSELNGLVGHPVGVWRNCMLFLETTDLVSGKPRLILPVLWKLRWILGSNESYSLTLGE